MMKTFSLIACVDEKKNFNEPIIVVPKTTQKKKMKNTYLWIERIESQFEQKTNMQKKMTYEPQTQMKQQNKHCENKRKKKSNH